MEVVKCWEEPGVTIPAPYVRHIKVFFAPDKNNVPEMTFTHALLYPNSRTDYHTHDKPELIQIISGHGIAICDGEETQIGPDMALYVRAGEMHQVINTGEETLKLATVFVPGFNSQENFDRCLNAAKEQKA